MAMGAKMAHRFDECHVAFDPFGCRFKLREAAKWNGTAIQIAVEGEPFEFFVNTEPAGATYGRRPRLT